MYAITGATGQLGRLAITALLKSVPGPQVVALVRDPARAADLAAFGVQVRPFDYDAQEGLAPALEGVKRLLLISSDDVERRVAQHRAVIEAAAKVEFLAYTSVVHADRNALSVAPSHRETEAMIVASGLLHAILRNGWYTENYLIGAEAAVAGGVLYGSTGEGRISGAAREDYANGAAAVMVKPPEVSTTFELAGDTSFTLADVAAALADASGRRVAYHDLSEGDYARKLKAGGVPSGFAETLAAFSAGAANGILEDNSGDLGRLIGRPTRSLHDIVRHAIGKAGS